jgi:predicted O-linked N-acetylglucosamine transferase (SPINDLY family)
MRAMAAALRLSPAPLEEMGLYLTALSLPLKAEELQVLAHGLALAAQTRAGSDSPLRASQHEKAGMQITGKKIRLGFLSPNFREHPSAQLHWRHFALRDRNRFEVFAFSLHRSEGRLRERITESCDVFREVSELSSREIAARIALDEIDILVDLAGHKDFSRPEVLALRPAPLQVSYLGLPGTIGCELVDYRLTDAHATPLEADGSWSEKLVRLPNTAWVYNDLEEIADVAPSRDAFGLPEFGFVFCCFNANYKIEPDAFSAWMRLLNRIQGSVLWLLDGGEVAQGNLRREAVARGVSADRLVFAPRIPRADHLARHACADLFLDTFYYGAHTTAADALWAGLPVLTCPGSTMASRIGASIVLATGLPELVAPDHAAYEAMALRLATHPQELAALRDKLAHNRTQCAMFDTAQRVRELDRAFEIMWQRHLAGLPPDNFAVPSELGASV